VCVYVGGGTGGGKRGGRASCGVGVEGFGWGLGVGCSDGSWKKKQRATSEMSLTKNHRNPRQFLPPI
jgi:hypothetical protein